MITGEDRHYALNATITYQLNKMLESKNEKDYKYHQKQLIAATNLVLNTITKLKLWEHSQ